jgi:hypothetical protein
VATAQAVAGVVGPYAWPTIFAATEAANPALAFYIATALSTVGVGIALTFPSLDEQSLAQQAAGIAARRRDPGGGGGIREGATALLSPGESVQ